MSYMRFRQQCDDCKAIWNAAFGIVGTRQIAAPPSKCPKCGSAKIVHYGDGWEMDGGEIYPKPVVTRIGDAVVHGNRAMSDVERAAMEEIIKAAYAKLSGIQK